MEDRMKTIVELISKANNYDLVPEVLADAFVNMYMLGVKQGADKYKGADKVPAKELNSDINPKLIEACAGALMDWDVI